MEAADLFELTTLLDNPTLLDDLDVDNGSYAVLVQVQPTTAARIQPPEVDRADPGLQPRQPRTRTNAPGYTLVASPTAKTRTTFLVHTAGAPVPYWSQIPSPQRKRMIAQYQIVFQMPTEPKRSYALAYLNSIHHTEQPTPIHEDHGISVEDAKQIRLRIDQATGRAPAPRSGTEQSKTTRPTTRSRKR